MTTTVKFRDWELIMDRELTRSAYENVPFGSADGCTCDYCKNFSGYREQVYPDEIKKLLSELGIDFRKESEISHFYSDKNGLHHYGGWFHFKGRFVGKSCAIPTGTGFIFELGPINDRFSIGFRPGIHRSFFNDATDLVQVEFYTVIPWTI